MIAEGIARVVVGARDPNPEAAGGIEMLRARGVEVELLDAWRRASRTRRGGSGLRKRRPFVTYKVAASLDGRVVVPGRRWVTGEASRRLVHELRAVSDASRSAWARSAPTRRGSTRASVPDAARSAAPARVRPGPAPGRSELELRSGPLAEELRALAAEGVQSLLLEGGPTLAGAFLDAALIDKLLVFVAPVLAGGDGPHLLPRLRSVLDLSRLSARLVGEDVLLEAYVHEP